MRIVFLIFVLLLTGCATVTQLPELETLLNPSVSAEQVQFSVKSNGCTENAHFEIELQENNLVVKRLKPDLCRAATRYVSLAIEFNLPVKPVTFSNPLIFTAGNQPRR